MSTFEERRRARGHWPIRRSTLEDEPLTDERIPDDGEARLEMVARLTREQWTLAGKEFPDYRRDAMPGRVIRRR